MLSLAASRIGHHSIQSIKRWSRDICPYRIWKRRDSKKNRPFRCRFKFRKCFIHVKIAISIIDRSLFLLSESSHSFRFAAMPAFYFTLLFMTVIRNWLDLLKYGLISSSNADFKIMHSSQNQRKSMAIASFSEWRSTIPVLCDANGWKATRSARIIYCWHFWSCAQVNSSAKARKNHKIFSVHNNISTNFVVHCP